jgi:hypothetical protein
MPGMWTLASLKCTNCSEEFYGNLSAGYGLLYPGLLRKGSGELHQTVENNWYTELMCEAYQNREGTEVEFSKEQNDDLSNPILLNCIDINYIHCINKLLNAQYYLEECPDRDLIVLVPAILEWMVPDSVDGTWVIDLSLEEGRGWYDYIAEIIHSEIDSFNTCSLSIGFPFPHPEDYNITEFTSVERFPIDEWEERLNDPTITFIWRGADSSARRLWSSWIHSGGLRRKARGYLNLLDNKFGEPTLALREQRNNIIETARLLREIVPNVNCGVAGVGTSYDFPDWMADIRFDTPCETEEQRLCGRYAESHIVVGAHGSHLALPSAHAGAVVQVIDIAKRGNMLTDLILHTAGRKETLFRYRVLPATVSNKIVAHEVISVLLHGRRLQSQVEHRWRGHDLSARDIGDTRQSQKELFEFSASMNNKRGFPLPHQRK